MEKRISQIEKLYGTIMFVQNAKDVGIEHSKRHLLIEIQLNDKLDNAVLPKLDTMAQLEFDNGRLVSISF